METNKEKEDKKIKSEPALIDAEVLFKTSDSNPYLTIKKHNNYFFAERNGVDSVAFVLFAINTSDEKRIGMINEIKPSIGKFVTGAFGGSIDQDRYKEDLRILVQEEAMEEAGFDVKLDDISYYGKMIVSTQMNQYCHLFGITVDKFQQKLRTTTNPAELTASIAWLTLPEVLSLEDWKGILIVAKRMTSSNITIKANTTAAAV